MELHTDTFNRLLLGIMEKDRCTPEEALAKLEQIELNMVCGDMIKTSVPLQAALLTAVNTSARAFLGGIHVSMPENTACLLPWPGNLSLNRIVEELGGHLSNSVENRHISLLFGLPGKIEENQFEVVCNNWQAGISVNGKRPIINTSGNIPTAGIFAGAFSVCLAFLKASCIDITSCDQSIGISLWRPDLDWLDKEAEGPVVEFLPAKYWILGLGHLGQSYLWNIGLLPYSAPEKVSLLLQDDDFIVKANWNSGLLTKKDDTGLHKTRICAGWLELRNFITFITERRFDFNTTRAFEEPFVALCGFDSADSRLPLENAGFDFIVESGLGGNLGTFDIISQHTFPGTKTPEQLWGDMDESSPEINEKVHTILQQMSDDEECGIIPLNIASKSLSASFAGACGGALIIAELLRGLHGGKRYDKISLQLRHLENRKAVQYSTENFTTQLSRNGFIYCDNRLYFV